MARCLQIFAVVCALAVATTWFLLGAHTGWSQTKIPQKQVDPVTEIEFTTYTDGFVPGVDFLGAGLVGSVALFAFGIIVAKLQRKSHS